MDEFGYLLGDADEFLAVAGVERQVSVADFTAPVYRGIAASRLCCKLNRVG